MSTVKSNPAAGKVAGRVSLHQDPLVSAAWLYYYEQLTQAEIADILKVSRSAVANMLAKARDDGVVTITLDSKHLSIMSLAQEVRARFHLEDVLVVPSSPHADSLSAARSLGSAGALYLDASLASGDILATGWGVTMLAVARALNSRAVSDVTIAQLLGGFSTADSFNPSKVASLIADKLGARLYHLYVPAVVGSKEVRDILLSDPAIHSALETAKSASKAILGIGKVGREATMVQAGFISAVQMGELQAKGAVGDIAARFYDIDGQLVATSLNDRLTGLTLEDLAKIRPVIAVAGGIDKAKAILGALRGRHVDVLITDQATTEAVLAWDEELANSKMGPRHEGSSST